MTLLVYLGHPAHFHLFKETIKNLESKSHHVIIVIKSKDVLEQLLIESKLPYINVAPKLKKKNKFGLYFSFFTRLYALAKLIKKYKPTKLVGSAAELAILGKFFKLPSYIFFEDDLEVVPQFAKVVGAFSDHLICPNCCSAWKWNHKKIGHNSYHELAYLHPNNFKPDISKVNQLFDLKKRNFILRFAQLTAYHDVGKSGITTSIAQQLITALLPFGNIYITSERPLEPQFEKYRIQISPLDIHHALYFADMYIGDSQTMAAEAAVLGTPAIRFNDFVGKLGYLEELEHKYQLTFGIKTNEPESLINRVKALAETENLKNEWLIRKEKMLNQTIDFSKFMTTLLER